MTVEQSVPVPAPVAFKASAKGDMAVALDLDGHRGMSRGKGDEFSNHPNYCCRLFWQIWLLMKLYWKERRGDWGLTILEIIFPAYPVLVFYILITIDVFPFERFVFAPVDFYAPTPLDVFDVQDIFEDPSILGFAPKSNSKTLELREKICLQMGLTGDQCGQTVLFDDESAIIKARSTNLIMAVNFNFTQDDPSAVNDFTLLHQQDDFLAASSTRILFPDGSVDGDGFSPRVLSPAENLLFFGITAVQKAANEVLLKEKFNISTDVTVTYQMLPDKLDISTRNFFGFVYPFFFMDSLFFNLRGMLIGLGLQAEKGIREAMELKGMDRLAYWLAAFLNYGFTTQLTVTVVVSLIFATQFYSGGTVSYGFIYAIFTLYGTAQTALGVLISVCAGDRVTASRVFIYAIICFIAAQIMFIVSETVVIPRVNDGRIKDFGARLLFLVYLVPYTHILSISTDAELLGVDVNDPSLSSNFRAAYFMLLFDTFLYFIAALFIDQLRQVFRRRAVGHGFKKKEDRMANGAYDGNQGDDVVAAVQSGEYGIVIKNLVKTFVVPMTKNADSGKYELKPNESPIEASRFDFLKGKRKILRAIDGLTLMVKRNEIFCLLGHNGAGKTTTFNCLVGSLTASSGDAWVSGFNIAKDRAELRRNLGVCPQQDIVLQHVKAIDQLVFQAMLFGKTKDEAVSEAEMLLDRLELGFKKNEYAKNMSGGQRRRLTLALALIGSPKVIVLDEPTTGLDPNNRRRIWKLLQDLKSSHTILMTTHSLEEADALADTIAIMSDGKLNVIGSSLELKRKYGSGYRLTCLKNRDTTNAATTAMVTDHDNIFLEDLKKDISRFVPDPSVLSNAGAEVAFGLKTEYVERFSALFNFLENEGKQKHDLSSFGLAPTSLEDVFLNLEVKQHEAEVELDDAKKSEGGKKKKKREITWDINELETKPHIPRARRQLYAIAVQVFTSMIRSPISYTFLIIFPIVFSVVFSEVSKALSDPVPTPDSVVYDFAQDAVNDNGLPSFNMNPALVETDFFAVNSNVFQFDLNQLDLEIFDDTASLISELELDETTNVTVTELYSFLSNARSQNDEVDSVFQVGGYEFYIIQTNDTAAILSANLIIEQTNSLSLSILLQTLFNQAAVDEVAGNSRRLTNKVGVLAAEVKVELDAAFQAVPGLVSANDITGGGLSFIVAIALVLQGPHFTTEMMNLRVKGVKEMLLLSGLPRWLFWIGNVLCSWIILLIPGFSVYIILFVYGSGGTRDNSFIAYILLFGLFGLPVVLFGYLLSFLVNNEEAAPQFSAEFSQILLLIPWLLTTFVFEEQYVVFENLFTVLSPGYGVYRGLSILNTASANEEPLSFLDVFKWDKQFIQTIFFMLVSACFYGTILYATDAELLTRYKAYRNSQMLQKKLEESRRAEGDLKGLDTNIGKGELNAADIAHKLEAKEGTILDAVDRENLEDVSKGILPPPISAMPKNIPDEDMKIMCNSVNKNFILNDGSLFHAVTDASLGVRRNEIFGLLGPNGAGKTTLIKCITGLDGYVMDSGLASICGLNILSDRSKVMPLMGICPQFDALLDTLTGRELLRMFARMRGVPKEDVNKVVQSYLDMLNLTPKADSTTKNYSGGNKRRLSVALSMIGSPRAIFMDEPSTGLDPSTRRKLWKFLQEKSAAKLEPNADGVVEGRAILLTTHSMEEADALCSNIAIMVSSSIRTVGTSQELKTRYSAGLMVVFSLSIDTAKPTDKEGMDRLMISITPTAAKVDDSLTNVKYFLPKQGITWGLVFGKILESHETLGFLDFAVSQRTLEDVFIEFANLQPGEDS